MKILLTGATGWIGKGLAIDLCRKGHELRCLVRNTERALAQTGFPAEFIEWDGVSSLPNKSMNGIDAVLHLMGESVADGRWTVDRKQRILNSRVQSTRILKQAAFENGIQTFISASAIGFYGDRGEEQLSEHSSPGADFLADVCQQWERESLASQSSKKMRSVAIRIGIVLGKDGGALEKMKPPYKAGVGGPLAGGQQWMSWIHLQDLKRIFIKALEDSSLTGPINAVAPEAVRQADFSSELARSLGSLNVFPTPKFALSLAFGEMASILVASTRVVPSSLMKIGFKFEYANLRETLTDICRADLNGEKELEIFQYVEKSHEEIFPFFSDEKNLEILTPEFLKFKVLGKSTEQLEAGTLIDYSLKLHGVPVAWQSRIENWNPPNEFVDTQLKGPYSLWHHTHSFEKLGQGTLLIDRVRYKLPMGRLGGLAAGWKVDSDVSNIFKFRRKKISEIFR